MDFERLYEDLRVYAEIKRQIFQKQKEEKILAEKLLKIEALHPSFPYQLTMLEDAEKEFFEQKKKRESSIPTPIVERAPDSGVLKYSTSGPPLQKILSNAAKKRKREDEQERRREQELNWSTELERDRLLKKVPIESRPEIFPSLVSAAKVLSQRAKKKEKKKITSSLDEPGFFPYG